jgi:putative nucleotidyltransferase with HDIG domain
VNAAPSRQHLDDAKRHSPAARLCADSLDGRHQQAPAASVEADPRSLDGEPRRQQTSPPPRGTNARRDAGCSNLALPISEPNPTRLRRYAGPVALTTLLVCVTPILAVWWLRSSRVVSTALGMVIAMTLSLCASYLGRLFWERRARAGDLLFAELMLWGFLRRWRNERRVASALELLAPMSRAQSGVKDGLSAEAQASALEELSAALEATDPHTHGHSRRVARHAWMIARQLGLAPETVARIRAAAALHDVGKIYTPTSILRKPGPLTDEEFDVIKRHPVDGARMVAALGDGELRRIVRHHHERLDGTGYPDRLPGEEIPLGARIIAVADTFDAITSARPYRRPRSHKEALDVLKYEAGTQLDPQAVRAFCAIYSGRRPFLALWASLTSLPAHALAWLSGGVAGVAAAAQIAAVAAIATVGAATVAQPVGAQHSPRAVKSADMTGAGRAQPARAVSAQSPNRTNGRAHRPPRRLAGHAPAAGSHAQGASAASTSGTPGAPASAGEGNRSTPTQGGTGTGPAPTEGGKGEGATPTEVKGITPTPTEGGKGERPTPTEVKGKGPTPTEGKGPTPTEGGKGKGPTPIEVKGKGPTPTEGKGPTPTEGGKGKGPTPSEEGVRKGSTTG